jgi:hypothetical protein
MLQKSKNNQVQHVCAETDFPEDYERTPRQCVAYGPCLPRKDEYQHGKAQGAS